MIRLRPFRAPLDRREFGRLLLVGACIATAAAANLARSALPQPQAVAVGVALLGGLLVLRRPPKLSECDETETAEGSPTAMPGNTAAPKRGRSGEPQREAVQLWIDDHTKRLDDLESRFTSLSGRQTAIHVSLRDQVAQLESRIAELQAAIGQVDQRNVRLFQRLVSDIAEETRQIAALTQPRAARLLEPPDA